MKSRDILTQVMKIAIIAVCLCVSPLVVLGIDPGIVSNLTRSVVVDLRRTLSGEEQIKIEKVIRQIETNLTNKTRLAMDQRGDLLAELQKIRHAEGIPILRSVAMDEQEDKI